MFTPDGLDFLYNSITNDLLKARVLVSGQYVDVGIQKTVLKTDSIQIYVYVPETVVGTITKYQLMLVTGKVMLERTENLVKDGTRGLLNVFEIRLQEV